MFVRLASPQRRLEIYKKVKGYCALEGISFVQTMQAVLDEKVADVENILDYDMAVNYMDMYMAVSHGKE